MKQSLLRNVFCLVFLVGIVLNSSNFQLSAEQPLVLERGSFPNALLHSKIALVDGFLESELMTYIKGRVLVEYSVPVSSQDIRRLSEQTGSDVQLIMDGEKPLLLSQSADGSSTEELMRRFYAMREVYKVSVDAVREVAGVPNDPLFDSQWQHTALDSAAAWDIEDGSGRETIIAVIDTGVAYDHPDLADNMWDGSACVDENGAVLSGGCPNYGWDFYSNDGVGDNDPYDEGNHGTAVAGIIGAVGNNGFGGSGINPNARIMALKAGSGNYISTSAAIRAINFAVANGADVINASYGGTTFSSAEMAAIENARARNVLFIASAGNSGVDLTVSGNNYYPCEYALENVICVAATTEAGDLYSQSNFGYGYGYGFVDVAAPGELLFTTNVIQVEVYSEDFSGGTDVVDTDYSIVFGDADWGATDIFGSDALYTHDPDGDSAGVYDNFAENSRLAYVSDFDMTMFETGYMSFYLGCSVEDIEAGEAADGLRVLFSDDGGGSYNPVAAHNNGTLPSLVRFDEGAVGSLLVIPLENRYLNSDEFTFAFEFFSDGDNEFGFGCSIANVLIEGTSSPQVASGYGYNYFASKTGTSFAAPVVAGLVSLLWDFYDLSIAQIRDILLTTGDSLSSLAGKVSSERQVNSLAALQAARDIRDASTTTAAPTTTTAAPTTTTAVPTTTTAVSTTTTAVPAVTTLASTTTAAPITTTLSAAALAQRSVANARNGGGGGVAPSSTKKKTSTISGIIREKSKEIMDTKKTLDKLKRLRESIEDRLSFLRTRRPKGVRVVYPDARLLRDMNPGTVGGDAVLQLQRFGALDGWGGRGNFEPNLAMNRASAFKLMMRLQGHFAPDKVANMPFLDVDRGAWFAPWIGLAYELGLAGGFEDGLFRPNGEIRRAEMLAMIYKVMGVSVDARNTISGFNDVDDGVWFTPYFVDAVNRGVLVPSGGGGGFLGPLDFVTREEFVVTVVKVLESLK